MTDILTKIIEVKRHRIEAAASRIPLGQLKEAVAGCPVRERRFARALAANHGLHIIAEIKRASPSKGPIDAIPDPAAVAMAYADAGAAAISVLTEEDFFLGSLGDLRAVRSAVTLPVLRKDFVIDEYQLFEAVEAGADAVLLIAAALGEQSLGSLLGRAHSIGLDVLVEVHNEEEMLKASDAGADLVGVNNRNLKTFEVDLETSVRLAPLAPAGCILVAESGISNAADIERLVSAGFKNFLIGESLVKSENKESLFSELLAAGRAR